MDPDLKLVKDCQNGNTESFSLLYDKYIKKIFDFVYFKTHHKETAEDIVSQTFLKALENIDKFDSQKGHFISWIYQIARNNVIDHYRSQKFTEDIEDAFDLSDKTDIEKDTDIKLKLENVKKYLQRLTAQEREIVLLKLWQDLPHKEIAQITGKTEQNSKVIFSRALKKIQRNVLLTVLLLFFTS